MATHIIASAMPPKKAVDFTRYRIVKPAWVMDSIQAGRLLPWTDYRVIEDGPRQKTIKFGDGKMFSQSTQQSPRGYRDQTQNSFYASQFQKPSQTPASSSPFRPGSAIKPPPAFLPPSDKVEDIDDMDVDALVHAPTERLEESEEKSHIPPIASEHTSPSLKIESAKIISEPVTEPPKVLATDRPDPPGGVSKAKPLTSEEHNALLLADPKIRKSSTANPDFLKQFYSESRLHHLSSWKAQLKARMQSMAAEKGPALKGIRKKGSRCYIMHVDFDSCKLLGELCLVHG